MATPSSAPSPDPIDAVSSVSGGDLKKFALLFGWVVLYLCVWALALLPLALWAESRGDAYVVGLVFATFLPAAGGLIPCMHLGLGRVYHFRGAGVPVSKAALEREIEQVNQWNVPVHVERTRRGLKVTWRYGEAAWWERLAGSGLAKCYELHIRLDDRTKTAVLADVMKSVDWGAGPRGVSLGAGYTRGLLVGAEIGAAWGIRETFAAPIDAYAFDAGTIKHPVLNTILRAGWDVRFGLW